MKEWKPTIIFFSIINTCGIITTILLLIGLLKTCDFTIFY